MTLPQPVFRFAPSPNGRLHLGHAYSALLNQKMAEEAGGRLLLRIEDTDQTRCRPEFVQAIHDDLRWLGLRWEEPVRVQSEHMQDYRDAIAKLWTMGAVYPCFCSRKRMSVMATRDPDGQPHYCGDCKRLPRDVAEGRLLAGAQAGWRLDMQRVGDAAAMDWGDLVIAKFDVGSCYHIAVVVDDATQGVTHVVRGKDVEAATSIHKVLQRLLGLPTPHYHHHDLILDEAGQKLSKSIGSAALSSLRAEGVTVKQLREKFRTQERLLAV